MPDLKLASNWKSCGYHYDMRRWAHGNSRVTSIIIIIVIIDHSGPVMMTMMKMSTVMMMVR